MTRAVRYRLGASMARYPVLVSPSQRRLTPRTQSPSLCGGSSHTGIQHTKYWSESKRFVMIAAQNHPDLTPDTGQADQSNDSSPTPGRPAVPRSRMVGLWVASMLFAFVLLLLLIFVLENGQHAEVSLFGVHGHLSMGLALLLAAIFGVLLVALPGTARIVQLRTLEHRRNPRAGTRLARRSVSPAWDDTPDQKAHR